MSPYDFALGIHLMSVLTATAASAVAFQAALRLRGAADLAEAQAALLTVRRAVPVFPLSVLGLLATGGFMTHQSWTFTTPFVVAGLTGLALIVVLGSGIEASRMRRLGAELGRNGLTEDARHMTRDPVAWTAKFGTLTLIVAVVLDMVLKPDAIDAAALIVAALALAPLLARPFWRAGATLNDRSDDGTALARSESHPA